MSGYSPGIRTYLSQRIKRRRRDLAAAGVEFAERRAILSAQPTLNSEIVVKALGTALGPGLEKENGGNGNDNGKESQKRTAGTGVKEIEKKVRFNPNSKRQPGQVLKLHVTAKDLASGQPNFGWIDSPPALSPQEASEGMRQALAWRHRQPKIRVRRYDKNPRTGEPILETEQEVSVKSLGPSLRETMGGAASLGGRAASKLGLLVDELGKFRCPPGTPAANQFTDSFGANCFNPIGLMRDAAGGIADWFGRHTSGITNWFDRRVEIGLQHEHDYVMEVHDYNVAVNAANLDASRGDVIGTYETMDAAWGMREQVLAALKELHASGVDSEMNEDLWTVLAALGDPNGDVGLNLDWEGLFTGLWGKQVDENGELLPGQFVYNPDIPMKENLILQRTQITDEVLDFLEGGGMLGAKDAYYQGDPDVREMVSRYLDDHEQVMRGTLGSLLDEVDRDPEGMAALKRVGFRTYQKHLEPGGFKGYWGTAGECRPLYNGAGEKGLACEVEFNPGALIFEGLLIGNEPLIPADGQKLTLVDTFPGYEHTDAARWAKINDFLKAQALRDRFDQGSRDAFDIEAKDRVGGLEKQAAFVAYHEFAHVRQYSQMQHRIMDAYTANGNQFAIMAYDGTKWVSKQLLEDPSEWSSGEWANAVNTVFFNELPQGVDFPPVDLDSLEGTMLAHVAGARIQREIDAYHSMENPLDGSAPKSQEEIQGQINLIMMEAMAELEASRRMGLIEGPGVDAFLAWMHEPPSKHIGVVPAENLPYKPLPVWATDGPVLKPSDLGPPSWDQDLPSGYEITPSGLIVPVAPDVKPDSRVQPIDGVNFVPPAPTIAPEDWDYFDQDLVRQRMGMLSTTDPIQFGNMPDPEMDSRPMGLGYGERMPTKGELRAMPTPEFRTWLEGERQKINITDVSDPAYPHTALLHRTHMQNTDMVGIGFFDDLPGRETGLAGVIPDSRRGELDILKEDIRTNGFREPLKIYYNPKTGDVNLGDGDMRLAAARELRMRSIPTRIRLTTKDRVDTDDRKTIITGGLADVKDGKPSSLGIPTTRIDTGTRKLQLMKAVRGGSRRDNSTRTSDALSPTKPPAHWGPGGMRSASFIPIYGKGGLVDERDWGPAGLDPKRRSKLPRKDRKRFKQLEEDLGGFQQQLNDANEKLDEANGLPFGEGPWGTGYAGVNTPDSGWWDDPDNRARMAAIAEAQEEYDAAQEVLDATKLEMYEIDDSIFQFDRGFQKRQGVGAYGEEEMELRANRVEERGGMRSASFIPIYGKGGLVDERDWGPAGLDPKRRSKLPRKDRKRFKQLEEDLGGFQQQLDDANEKLEEANSLPMGEGSWGTGYAGVNDPTSGWWDDPDNRAKMAAVAEAEGELDAVREAMDAIKLEMYEIDDSTFPFDWKFRERHGTDSARTPTSGDDERGGMRSQKGVPGLSTPLEERPASGGRKERDAEDVGWSKEVMDMPDSEWDEQLRELETVHNGDPGFLNDEEYGKMLQLRDRQIAEEHAAEVERGDWDDAIEMTDDQLEKRIVNLKFYREEGLTDEEADQLVVLEAESARRDAEWIAQEAEEAAFDLEIRADDAAILMDDISNMGEAELQAEIEDLEAKKARGDKLVPEEKEALARLQSELGNAQDARAEFDEARLEAHQSPLEMTEQEVIDEIDSLYNTEWDAPGRKLDDIDEHRREELMEYQRRMEDQIDPREMSDEEILGEISELYGRRELDDIDAAYLSKLEYDSERPTRKMNTRQSGRPETREEMDARQRYGGNSWQAREARRNVELREAERREEFEARRRGGMRSSRIESSTGENGPKLKPRPPEREWDKGHDLIPDRFHENGHWVENADGNILFKKYDKETLKELEQLKKRRLWLRRSRGKNENIDRELGEIDQRIADIGSMKRIREDAPGRGGMRSRAGGQRADTMEEYERLKAAGVGLSADNPIITNDPAVARQVLLDGGLMEGQTWLHVQLDSKRQYRTLLSNLKKEMKALKKEGGEAPIFDLCKVTVPGTNLFCQKHMNRLRGIMPQLSGKDPAEGSKAAGMLEEAKAAAYKAAIDGGLGKAAAQAAADKIDEVSITPEWLDFVQRPVEEGGLGIAVLGTHDNPILWKASELTATQSELEGKKVIGMMISGRDENIPWHPGQGAVLVTRDGYIIDGHHRWAAVVGLDITEVDEEEVGGEFDVDMPVVVLDMTIEEAMRHSVAFADDMGMNKRDAQGQIIPRDKTPEEYAAELEQANEQIRKIHTPSTESELEQLQAKSHEDIPSAALRGGMRSRTDKRSKKRVAVRKRKEAFRKGWDAVGGPTLDEFLDDLLEVDGPKSVDRQADELADEILGGIGKLIKKRVPGMRSATSASAVSHQRERRIRAIDAQREGLEAARTNLLGRLGNARLNNNTEKVNELTEALDDLQSTLRPLSPERRSLVRQRDSRTRGRGMRSIKTTRTSKDPNTAQRMNNRNASVQAASGTAFNAPPGWKEPRKNRLIQSQEGSKLVPKIQSRQNALAEHRQHLLAGIREFLSEMRRGEIVGPRGFYRNVHPIVVEFLSTHSDDDVLTALDTAATLWHRGFDRRVRVPLDKGELDDLFKNRSHHRPHQAVGANAASDLRANYDLSNGIALNAPAEARPINGYLYHATHDDAIDKHLNDLAGPQLERYADLWDPGVEGAPWGNAHSMGGDIDLVLRPEVSDRTHYTNGSAMYRQGVPVPMNSDNPAEILAALIPLNRDGEKQPHAITANDVSQLLEAGITGDWTSYANKSATYRGGIPGMNPLTVSGRPASLSNQEHHQAQVLGGVQLDDIEFVRYPIDKANWRSRILTDDDVGRNDKSSLTALRNAGFSDSEIDYFYAAVRDGRVSGLHNATWLKQALVAQDAKVRFDRMGVDVMFTNPDGIDLLNVDTFMSGLTNLNISGETAPEVLRKRIRMEIIDRAEELLLDVRREISPRKNDSKRTLV